LNQLLSGSNALFSTQRFTSLFNQQVDLYQSELSGSMMAMPFGMRNIIDYMNAKKEDVLSQLTKI
jgi:hypothetical protein